MGLLPTQDCQDHRTSIPSLDPLGHHGEFGKIYQEVC